MTLRIIGGTLLIVNDQLANSADCCCDPPEPECRFCSNRLDTINLGTLTFVVTKTPGATFFLPCDTGVEGTYVFEPTCANCYNASGGNEPLRHICGLDTIYPCPYDPTAFISFTWVPYLPPQTNPRTPGSINKPWESGFAGVGMTSSGIGLGVQGIYIDCVTPTGFFDFNGYRFTVTWDRFA